MAISSITLSEVIYGAEKSSHPNKNLDTIEEFISHLEVLFYDPTTSQQYGRIKSQLERKGQMIGEIDLHIAAHASSHSLTLVSNNLREFERIPNLDLENWVTL